MNERELIALEDLCDTLHKEVAALEKERRELKEKVADLEVTARGARPPRRGRRRYRRGFVECATHSVIASL